MESFDSPLGSVELTDERLKHILEFHPEIKAYRKYFAKTLGQPDLIRPSKSDNKTFILYKLIGKYNLAIVIKTNSRNFILTVYLTSKHL